MSIRRLLTFTAPIPAKCTGREILDLPPQAYTLAELEGAMADLRSVNRYLGDRRALLKHLAAKLDGLTEFSVLDIATGSADLPVAIVEWARKGGRNVGKGNQDRCQGFIPHGPDGSGCAARGRQR